MSNPMDLTEKDYETLLEALDAWESAPATDGFLMSIVGNVLERNVGAPASPAEKERQTRDEINAAHDKARVRRQTTIILRAKIELARQAAQAAGIATAKGVSP